jgi:hypothetical protein
MIILDSLTEYKDHNDCPVYLLSEIRSKSDLLELCADGYLAVLPNVEKDSCLVVFGVFTHVYTDDTGEYVSTQFHGYGFSGALRECRHTYWGQDGYLFYSNGKVISLAFKELSKYFDEME